MERKRPEMYYLDEVYKGWYVLNADGTAIDINETETYETEHVPSRVPGLVREVKSRKTYTPEHGNDYDSLRDLALSQDDKYSTVYEKYNQIDESELIYTPAEVVAEMREWQSELSEQIDRDKIIEAASGMVATDDQLQNEQVRCRYCVDDKYACHSSGWSKYYWKYPMIDVGGEKQNLVPLDIAKAISLSPDALEIEEVYIDDHQELSYAKRVILDMSRISAAYISGQADEYLTINKSDRLSGAKIAVEAGFWAEDSDARHPMNNDELFGNIKSSQDAVASIQNVVSQGGERVEIADYNEIWPRVRSDLGRRGLSLMWNWQYRGMGESGADVHVVKADDITKSLYIADEIEARMMVDSVYDRLIRGLDKPSKGRPTYDGIEEGK
ncbi:MAG: hypothetical protein L0H38_02580 [bacterium]|nr:hypothetical protein [bacterium]